MDMTFSMNDVRPMMHLLTGGHFESKDRLHQTLEDVYNNFTPTRNYTVGRLDYMVSKFPEENEYVQLRKRAGFLIIFCRCMLKRILEEDGMTINQSLANLLAEIELHLLCDRDLLYDMEDMTQRIEKTYLKPSPVCCYQLIINPDLMIVFLDQCLGDLDYLYEDKEYNLVAKEYFVFLRNYLEFLTKDPILGNTLETFLVAVENIAYEMARYSFTLGMCNNETREYYYRGKGALSRLRSGTLKALVQQFDGLSSDAPLLSDELVIGYVKCVQDNLVELLKSNAISVADTLKGQLMTLREELSFLMHLLITYPPENNSEQENTSHIRLDFQALARNVGSVIISCFDSLEIDKMSLLLFDLIEKANVIEGELIKTIFCKVLQETEREPRKTDQLGSLILLLQNLKKFMDRKTSLIVIWKDHMNLILFIFYLIQNNIRGGSQNDDDGIIRNTLHLDEALMNHEELDGVLVSAQIVAFNVACYSLLKRYGKFCWWELYSRSKEHIDMQTRVGILKAIVLSSTTNLTDELMIAYGECVQDSLIELLRDAAFDPVKDHFNILHKGFSFLWRLLINYRDDEKLSHIKVGFQDLVRSVGSEVHSCFSNWLKDDIAKQSTTNHSKLVEKMNLIIVETEELLHLVNLEKIGRESPKTNQLGSLNLLLENWNGLMECESDLIITWKDQFHMIHEELVFFKSFITSSSTEDDESKYLCRSIMDAGHVAEYLLTTFSVGICPVRCTSLWISELTERVELIKAAVVELKEKNCNVKEVDTYGNDQSQIIPQALSIPTFNDVMVGFEVEMELIKKQLHARLKQLDVISIVGMPGLGKTTLARRIYEDPSTINYFDARAWCTVSQEYNKRQMLLTILGCIIQLTDGTRNQKESELSVMLHKQLKGRRYFIVLDDIWDIKAFMDLKCFFPDDNNGSRLMLTSRSKIIGSQAQTQCHSDLIEPGLLTDEQSWDLLARKAYNEETCPNELCQIGKEIAKKCRGLPLAVVVVGGVLAKGTQKLDFWEQISGNLSLYLARDSQSQFMAALELSYEYLPDCLKPMFLYLGAFPEDAEIHVDTLLRFWCAEGFVQKTESMSSETQAETNLMDLIDRSLVMAAKRRWDGRVKRCHVHDLLRDMCLAKAKEEKFMQQVRVQSELPDPVLYQRRLSIFLDRNDESNSRHLGAYNDLPKFSIIPPIYSLLFFHVGPHVYHREGIRDIISSLKLLKVFDAQFFIISQDVLVKDLIKLVHLKYVSFYADVDLKSIPLSISRLRSLETLIIKHRSNESLNVPETIWEMTKLRHLHINPLAKFGVASENAFILDNLQTLSTAVFDLGDEEKIFKKVPSLKKLSCFFQGVKLNYHENNRLLVNFESLSKLESLRVNSAADLRGQLKLPLTLKKLSISGLCLEWSQISIFHTLPNLEVLKLKFKSVKDKFWDMGDEDVFTKLKFLKLYCLGIKRWSASTENFPTLEKLVLHRCDELDEMPSDLGEIDTLREIHARGRATSFPVKLAKEIQEEQAEFGNDSLKFYIHAEH